MRRARRVNDEALRVANVRQAMEALQPLNALCEFRAVIDRRCPLDKIADAYRYVETGQKTGIVVITVAPEGSA